MKTSRLLRIIAEELEAFSEYRTYSQESPLGRGQVGTYDKSKPKSQGSNDGSSNDIQAFPDELPVNIGKARAAERYSQEQASISAQIKSADSPSQVSALQGKLDDITREKNKLAMSEIHSIFEEQGLSTEERIETLESLINAMFEKEKSGAGYVDRLQRLEQRVDALDDAVDASSSKEQEDGIIT